MKLSTGATCRNQTSDDASQWTRLESLDNCSGNKVQDAMFSESGTNVTKSDYVTVSISSLVLVVLGFVTFTLLQIICCGLLYFKKRLRFSVSAGEGKIVLSDTSSNYIHHYDYISSLNISTLPELPARPTQTTSCENSEKLHVNSSLKPEESDYVQSAALRIGVDLKEPNLYVRNELYDGRLQTVESDDNKPHQAHAETPENYRNFADE
jgi:hypothetical protein